MTTSGHQDGPIAKIADAAAMALPAVIFVMAAALATLPVAAGAAIGIAVALLVFWHAAGKSWRPPLIGLLLATACCAAALTTGEVRDFFLVPMAVPVLALCLCLGSLAAGRPLTGLLLNPLARGPKDWPRRPGLHRVYAVSTWVCIAMNLVNIVAQVAFYQAANAPALAAIHTATGPVFALIVGITVRTARRAVTQAPNSAI